MALENLPNIKLGGYFEEEEKAEKQQQKNNSFDVKNYLNVKLKNGEKLRALTIRLLPIDSTSSMPWAKVFVHNVKVPKELVAEGSEPYKSFICLKNTADIDHEKFGHKCPYCELNQAAYQAFLQETDPEKKKMLKQLSTSTMPREAAIVRCIERGKEDEGVKFWKFNLRSDGTDPYHTIWNLRDTRKRVAEAKGKDEDILDIINGKDLNITITEGTAAPQIIDDSERSPLSESEEQMREWLFDKKTWQEVFPCKPYEYLDLVSQMKIPWYDKQNHVWVDKAELDAQRKAEKEAIDAKINASEDKIKNEVTTAPQSAKKDDLLKDITLTDESMLPF